MTAPVADPEVLPGSWDDDFDHLYCCDPDVAYCGADISDSTEIGDEELEDPCPMCEVLEGTRCPRCGETR